MHRAHMCKKRDRRASNPPGPTRSTRGQVSSNPPDFRTWPAPVITDVSSDSSVRLNPCNLNTFLSYIPKHAWRNPQVSWNTCLKPGSLCQPKAEAQLTVSYSGGQLQTCFSPLPRLGCSVADYSTYLLEVETMGDIICCHEGCKQMRDGPGFPTVWTEEECVHTTLPRHMEEGLRAGKQQG